MTSGAELIVPGTQTVPVAVLRHPLHLESREVRSLPYGLTIAEILDEIRWDPPPDARTVSANNPICWWAHP